MACRLFSGTTYCRITFFVFLLMPYLVISQDLTTVEPDSINKKKVILVATGLATGYTAVLVGLSQTWYKQSERTSFHFFNDAPEWQQLDKAGHFWGAFHESHLGVAALQAAGFPRKKAVVYGGLLGFLLQSPIELLDGYAADYGASVSDLGANALGAVAVITQELAWGQLRIVPKYSFHQTHYAKLRPQVLGSHLPEQMLKDYNGQTYWLSADIYTFLPQASKYPKWLNLAVGYGGERMIYGQPKQNEQNGYQAYRQYYLALDLNLSAIKTRKKLLQKVFSVISLIHLPSPAVEYNRRQGFQFHPVYF